MEVILPQKPKKSVTVFSLACEEMFFTCTAFVGVDWIFAIRK